MLIEIVTPQETWRCISPELRGEIIELGAYAAQSAEYWELDVQGDRVRRLELKASSERDDQFRYYLAHLTDPATGSPVGKAMQWDVRWLL